MNVNIRCSEAIREPDYNVWYHSLDKEAFYADNGQNAHIKYIPIIYLFRKGSR